MSDQRPVDTQVLIVGGGPVGLSLANELGWRGVSCTLAEAGNGEIRFPAGEHIFSRSLEHMRRWGIAERARGLGWPPVGYRTDVVFATSVVGHVLARFGAATNTVAGEFPSPERPMMQAKFKLDPLLAETAAARESVTLRYGHRVADLKQEPDGVTAVLIDSKTDSTVPIRAAYVVGCDGARSFVRESIGTKLQGAFALGHNYAIYFKSRNLRELLDEVGLGQVGQIHTVLSASRPYLTTVDGDCLWRCSVYVPNSGRDPDARVLVRDTVGTEVDVEILQAQRWTGHEVVAQRYRHGRIFIAGDAAHLRWPKGGFGANTGIGDAVDIGWKLAAIIDGWGGEGLLESYETERRPIAKRNNRWAAENWHLDQQVPHGVALDDDSSHGSRARALASEEIVRLRTREFTTVGVQLGYRYTNSPICVPDDGPHTEDRPDIYVPSTEPGSRAPHVWISENVSILDHFGIGFTLVRFVKELTVDDLTDAARDRGVPITVLDIDPLTDSGREAAALYAYPLVLVRPDGHVAWRGAALPNETGPLLDRVCGFATPQDLSDEMTHETYSEGVEL
ncbi:FAD-dependent monooxygenase [Rhodococcus sp. MSC1_016]|uniref:FAD-dependent monooxygenase n=1 Tax=Rhodococcus sp. MSC1_016 TaxID=2909266 RepID=UPI00202E3C10|nr:MULTISPECIES: FAD-dependent monooxygenase [Rhodococcus]GLK33357.1 monooxygenase [Rhodococcus wratislaviensis]